MFILTHSITVVKLRSEPLLMKSHSSHRSHGSETQTVNSDTLYPNNQQFLRTNRNEVRGAVFFTQQIASSPSCVKERTKKCCRFFDSLLYTARSRLHCEISSDCVVGTHEINHFEQQKGELSPCVVAPRHKEPGIPRD